MVGIDISGVQPDAIPGSWEFVVVKLTEGGSVVNPRADQQWAFAHQSPKRGFYHYARPGLSDGATQARAFGGAALNRGFRPGLDMWQLDAEGMENGNVNPEGWRFFIDAFMSTALGLLGSAGFLYIGWPFYCQQYGTDLGALSRYPWWLPDYGPNDGQVHPYGGAPADRVVIHQFTSHGGLDQNRIVNVAKFNAVFRANSPLPPAPKVKPMHGPYTATWSADCDCPSGGAWMLTSDGGVVTLGTAPFHGSPAGLKVALAPGETWNEIRQPNHSLPNEPLQRADNHAPTSYVCVTSLDHRYGF